MKFNVTTENAKFFIDESKRVVVCVIEDTERMFLDFVDDNFKIGFECDFDYNANHKFSNYYTFKNKLYMPNKFIGVARCSENDEWNEEVGCLIAFSRAKDNLLNSFFKRANTYINTLDIWVNEAANTLNALGEKLTVNKEKRHNHIKELIGEDE